MFYVYILKSISCEKSYVGTTNDIIRRLGEHNSGKMAYTKKYKPWKIINVEKYDTLSEARKRESFLKTGAGRRFMKSLF